MRIVPVEKEDLPMVKALLAEVNLPLEGVEENFFNFLKLVMDGELAAVAGLEVYGKCGLLRSVAVAPAYQHSGLGRGITRAMINRARELGLTEIYLLTQTASDFFTRFGFKPIDRSAVDPAVRQSAEFKSACPASAVCMRLKL
ncbi:MAG: hypothetical protein PWP12_371 [Bacillota bacterium]|jgi:amino-acid N-acetyltransferase|nr:hypothetical protein [Bacillota bacterium]MDK2881793.1 hypothetical protein [Bacillota bacterium]MDK2960187.1 hypothetical protein [Bacillota bacterium]